MSRRLLRTPLTWVAVAVLGVGTAFGLYWFQPWKVVTDNQVDEQLSEVDAAPAGTTPIDAPGTAPTGATPAGTTSTTPAAGTGTSAGSPTSTRPVVLSRGSSSATSTTPRAPPGSSAPPTAGTGWNWSAWTPPTAPT